MDKVRTVSETKREFYRQHTRPINSVYRRVVEELMVESHLLCVNNDFRYDPIYALGVVTSFERFMQGYSPESDKSSIFAALCQAVGANPQQYRQDAETMLNAAKGLNVAELSAKIGDSDEGTDNAVINTLQAIAHQGQFKYSRLFAIGLYTFLAEVDASLVNENDKREEILKQLSAALHLAPDKLQKDLDLYRSNLDKMEQLLAVIEDALDAERKKREKQEQTQKAADANTWKSPA